LLAQASTVQRHFIHHKRASYFVIPNLYACDPDNKQEAARALAMNQLAGVLSDLDLVRWPNPRRWRLLRKSEFEELKEDEAYASETDLSDIRKRWFAEKRAATERGAQAQRAADPQPRPRRNAPLRSPAGASAPATTSKLSGWSSRGADAVADDLERCDAQRARR
jgi:hypothetical protein